VGDLDHTAAAYVGRSKGVSIEDKCRRTPQLVAGHLEHGADGGA
jgi:hypothetical protein